MNSHWKNWALVVLLTLNLGLIFFFLYRTPPPPPRLSKELKLSELKEKKLSPLETQFLEERKINLKKIKQLEHLLVKASMKDDTTAVNRCHANIIRLKNEDLKNMAIYFSKLGTFLTEKEQQKTLEIIGTFDRKPTP